MEQLKDKNMGRSRKININDENLKMANGKDWGAKDEAGRPVKSVFELIGQNNSYSNLNISEYEKTLNKMNEFDLQSHAVEVLEPIRGDRKKLTQNLLNKFREQKNQ